MSTTLQEYKNRVHFKGNTKRDYVNTKVSESIDSIIDNSQYGFTIKINGEEHNVAILSTKSTQDYERANVIAHNDAGLDRGSLFEWNDERWIVLQKMFRPEQPGFNGYAYKCTWDLKWVDKDGVLHIAPGYVNSGRTTNSLTYTPDVNYKFDNIVLRDTDWSMIAAIQQDLSLHAEMRFIIKGKAYRVTNVDNVSIENVSILSMVDDKLKDDDDLINGIASSSNYTIKLDVESPIKLFGGDIKTIPVYVMKDGIIQLGEEITLESSNPDIVEVKDNQLIGRGLGKANIICHLKKNPYVINSEKIEVEVVSNHEEAVDTPDYYIEGPDFIEWNTEAEYTVNKDGNWTFAAEYFSKIKHSEDFSKHNSIILSIKDKYAGYIVITATNGEQEITKEVLIKTL